MSKRAKRHGEWLDELSDEDLHFIKRFVLASGSLKELAKQYGVSYPTLRIRLDRLIEKIQIADDPANGDPFGRLIKTLVVDGKLASTDARLIIRKHEESGD